VGYLPGLSLSGAGEPSLDADRRWYWEEAKRLRQRAAETADNDNELREAYLSLAREYDAGGTFHGRNSRQKQWVDEDALG